MARKVLAEERPGIIFLTCLTHMLNLMFGNILTHPTAKPHNNSGKLIISFFTHLGRYSISEGIMLEVLGKTYKFVIGESKYLVFPVRFGTELVQSEGLLA